MIDPKKVKVGDKFLEFGRTLTALSVMPNLGVHFDASPKCSTSSKFVHNNDRDFWNHLKPMPVTYTARLVWYECEDGKIESSLFSPWHADPEDWAQSLRYTILSNKEVTFTK